MKRKTLEKGTKRKHKKNGKNKELMGTCNPSPQKVRAAAAAAVSPPPPPFHPPLSSGPSSLLVANTVSGTVHVVTPNVVATYGPSIAERSRCLQWRAQTDVPDL